MDALVCGPSSSLLPDWSPRSGFRITFLTAVGLDFRPPRSQSLPSPSLGGSEASESDSRVFRLGLCTTGRGSSTAVDTFSAKRTLSLLGFVLVSIGDETSEGPAILLVAPSLPPFLVTLGLIFVGAIAASPRVSLSSSSPSVLVIPAPPSMTGKCALFLQEAYNASC